MYCSAREMIAEAKVVAAWIARLPPVAAAWSALANSLASEECGVDVGGPVPALALSRALAALCVKLMVVIGAERLSPVRWLPARFLFTVLLASTALQLAFGDAPIGCNSLAEEVVCALTVVLWFRNAVKDPA